MSESRVLVVGATGQLGGVIARKLMASGTQVRAHLGYQPAAKDRVDMGRLRERLGVALPAPYSSSRV